MNFSGIGLGIASSSADEAKYNGSLRSNQIVFRPHFKSVSIKCEDLLEKPEFYFLPDKGKSELEHPKPELDQITSPISRSHKKEPKSNTCKPDVSARDVRISENFTCITAHGSKLKTTLGLGDLVVECDKKAARAGSADDNEGLETDGPAHSNGFLSCCFYCSNNLPEGKDIYFCRDKAFCSFQCQCMEILSCGLGESFAHSLHKPYDGIPNGRVGPTTWSYEVVRQETH